MDSEKKRIIVVDDEPNIRSTLKEFFIALGRFDVDTAEDGLEALDRIKANSYDCAFLDLQMPRMTGLELLHHIKDYDNTLPVIVMTGFPSLDAAVDTMRHGASDFLTKPVRLSQLKIVLERVLRERALLVENLRLMDQVRQKEHIEQLNIQLNRKIKEQSLLFSVAETISLAQSSDALYPEIVKLAAGLVDASWAVFYIFDHDNRQLIPLADSGLNGLEPSLGDLVLPMDHGFMGKAAAHGQPTIYNSLNNPLELSVNHRTWTVSSMVTMPVRIRDEVFGMLALGERKGQPFNEDDLFILQFLAAKMALSVENIALYENLWDNLHSTFRTLISAIEAKDAYTERHSQRVTALSIMMAEEMGLADEEVASIRFSGYLHDIGKIGIRDEILTKPGRLTAEEFEIMRTHPAIGEKIVSHLGLLQRDTSIIRHHHEAWDGSGYPDGLKGEETPLLSRIIIVADAFDAMTSNRPYRKALPVEIALKELAEKRWIQFDGNIVDLFLKQIASNPELVGDLSRVDIH